MTIEVVDVEAEIEASKTRLSVALTEQLYAPMLEKPKVFRFGKQLKNQRKRERRARRGK